MNRLLNWFTLIIKKQKGLKRWQRVVTVLAAMITFATTYALILPAITVEKNSTEDVGGMYLEKTAKRDDLLEDNALEPVGVSIAADMDNAVSFAYSDDDMAATAIFSTDEIIPEGAELVVNNVTSDSEEYADLSGKAADLLDKEFIYDVTTCSFYDFALVCDNVDVTPKTGLVDIQIIFRNNTNQHVNDVVYVGRFARPSEDSDGFAAMAVSTVEAGAEADDAVSVNGTAVNDNSAGESGNPSVGEDELVSLNIDESSAIELSDGIITSLSLKGSDLSRSDSLVGIIAGYVDEEIKAAAAETDAEVPEYDESQDEDEQRSSGEDASANADNNVSTSPEEDSSGTSAEDERKEITDALQMKTLKASGRDYTVTLTYDESSKIPEGASLTVSEISKDSKEYQTYLEETKKAMGLKEEETLPGFAARFFDIKIMVDGKEFNPESGVSVEITYAEPLAEYSDTEVNAVHFADEKTEAEMIEANTAEVQDDGKATVEFTAESFSVYGVIYTVDFHWEVNGKTYAFSIPGGGFVSFYDLVEVLGIEANDTNTEKDEIQELVDGVENITFSNPDLVSVSKVEETTTVGAIKEHLGLVCDYSVELTKDEIAEINAQEVKAGNWALIALKPFSTSESLTVTMKNGDKWSVKVTDAQVTSYNDIDKNRDYFLYVEYQGQYYALRNDGESVPVENNNLYALGDEFIWNYDYDWNGCWWINGSKYIDIDLDYNPVAVGNTWRYSWTTPDGQGGFDIYGYAHGDQHLSWNESDGFNVSDNHDISIKVYEREKPYHFTVNVNNEAYGSVECSSLETTAEDKKNQYPIYARTADRDCYFIKWQLDGNDLPIQSETIEAGQLTFARDNMVLTAVFGKSYSSPATQHINEWVDGLVGNPIISDKTAHVYDYDNRIYEIDISASSMRYTVDKSITLEFLTDASRSMYFPAQITPVEDGNYGNNLANWLRYHGDESQVYYTVADVGATATMYAVYYQRYTDDRGQWFAMDASYYYDGASGASAKSVLMVNSKSRNNYREDITNQIKSNNGNQTFTLSGVINTAPDKVEGQDWTRLDYLKAALTAATRALYKLDPNAQVGVLTFAGRVYESFRANVNNEPWMLNRIDNISLYGGTNQKVALDYYWDSTAAYNDLSIFTNSSTKKQVAILITDGAPNTTSVNWGANSIGGSATQLKNRNVELYTLGLSLDDVGDVNKNGLNGIATNASYAYQAQEGEEFALQIESMLRQILDKAKLVGEVSDTIDAAFYPVDVNGNPIASGTTVTQADGKIATYVENADGSWTVIYSNAEIGWPSVDANDNPILDTYGNIQDPGWETSIYIKAKEDFMGGNHINTNVGDNNQVKATGFKQKSATNGISYFNEPFINPLGVPYVNVDELKMDENSTEWRVYLGTDVNPRDELLKLWNSIQVNLVVKDNGDDEDKVITISNGNQMYYSDARDNDAAAPNGTSNETLPLSNFVNNELIAGLISNLENGQKTATASLTYRYFPYNHTDIIGTFDIVLTKTLTDENAAADNAPLNHETKEVGNEREVYTLTVTYNPTNESASEIYGQTTSGKSAGKVADGYDADTGELIQSENTHKIHVFAKNLEIQKKDMTDTDKLIDTAKFKLYRTAKKVIDPDTGEETNEYESGAVDLTVGEETKKVVQIGSEMTTSGGKITVENLSYAPDGVYYLEETKAPAGYIICESPMTIRLTLKDEYRDYKDPNPIITDISNTPYNWTQTVQKLAYANSKDGTGDSEKFVVEVLNNPGVTLPATGGPGTTMLYLLGIILTGIAGAVLIIKRRMKAA